jgi:hypothetical protein
MMLWLTSGHDVPLETARSDHRFTVASMTSWQAGRMWAELAWSSLGDRGAEGSYVLPRSAMPAHAVVPQAPVVR